MFSGIGLGIGLSREILMGGAAIYAFFIPSGNDRLITADGMTFKVRE